MTADHDLKRDPDPFVVGTLLVAVIGVLAQLSSLAIQLADRPARRPLFPQTDIRRRTLHEQVDEAIRITERISAFLSRRGAEAMGASFRSGQASLFLDSDAMNQYEQLITALSFHIGNTSHWTLELMRQDEEFAKTVGVEILNAIGSLSLRVNNLLAANTTFEHLLEETLFILRTLSAVLGRLRGEEN